MRREDGVEVGHLLERLYGECARTRDDLRVIVSGSGSGSG